MAVSSTSVAADFVTKVLHGRLAKADLVGVNGQAEAVETGQNSVEVLCMISRCLICHQHVIDVHESEVEVSKDCGYGTLKSLSGIS